MTVATRRSLLLFVLALAAVGAFVLVELPGRRATEREQTEAMRLFAFDPGMIDAVAIERAGEALRFEFAGTRWTMRAPVRDDAEAAAVVPVISSLAEATVLRDLGPDTDPARYGLTPPAVTITLLAARDTAAVLELGAYNVDRSAIYARRGDGRVILVPTSIQRVASLSADDYRNRRVVVFDIGVVRRFVIDSGLTGASDWRRGPGESWFTVAAGDTVRGDSVAVPAVLRRLRGMRVRAFVTEADTIRPPLVSVTIHKDDGSSQAVRFFAVDGGIHLARLDGNPRTVEVADDPSDIAQASLATLRDRRVLAFDPARARRLRVTTADTTAVLVRAGDAWALPNPALGRIDRERAAEFVRALRALRYVRRIDGADVDPALAPLFTLVIHGAGDTILDELYCAPAPGGGGRWLARSRSLGAVCEIEGSALDEISDRLARLRH